MTEKKFCVCCQTPREAEEMKIVTINKKKLWRCAFCINKRAQAKYASQPNQGK